MSALLAFSPVAVFVYPTWLSRTDDQKTKTIDNHINYLAVWAYFAGTHFLVYAPLLFLWMSLSGNPEPHAYWYAYWLKRVVSVLWFMFLTNEAAWLYIAITEPEDESFSKIEPILAAIFYPFIGLPTIGAISCDYWKAIPYYDKDERVKHCTEQGKDIDPLTGLCKEENAEEEAAALDEE